MGRLHDASQFDQWPTELTVNIDSISPANRRGIGGMGLNRVLCALCAFDVVLGPRRQRGHLQAVRSAAAVCTPIQQLPREWSKATGRP
jgi:hypothetical protein